MKGPLVGDELWGIVEPLLPPEPPRPKGGRSRVPNRSVLEGIVYVGIPWQDAPEGVQLQRRHLLATGLVEGGRVAASAAGAARQARETRSHRLVSGVVGLRERSGEKRGEKTGPNPVDRGRPGPKCHLLVDRTGVPLAVALTGAQVHDSTVFEEVVAGVEAVKGPKGRPRKRPDKLHAEQGIRLSALPEARQLLQCAVGS